MTFFELLSLKYKIIIIHISYKSEVTFFEIEYKGLFSHKLKKSIAYFDIQNTILMFIIT